MPWSGPDLGGEVVVEHRGAGISLFISENPGRLAPVASTNLRYEAKLQQCWGRGGAFVSGIRGANGTRPILPAWFRNSRQEIAGLCCVGSSRCQDAGSRPCYTDCVVLRIIAGHCPEVPLGPLRWTQSRTHRVCKLPSSRSTRNLLWATAGHCNAVLSAQQVPPR